MINHLPLANLILFMSMALAIPLFRKRSFSRTLVLGFIVLLLAIISSGVILWHVNQQGPIHYFMGGHDARIGIEFVVDSFSAFFTLFIVLLATIVYVYSSGDATEGIEEKEYGRYYILLFILLMSMFGILYTNVLFNT